MLKKFQFFQEQEATNEELRTANEETLSANEELLSTNEELETAKEELQDILETLDVGKRMEKSLYLLRKELEVVELQQKIRQQIEEKISKQQREFFLREQLKAIKSELGLEKDQKSMELEKFRDKIYKTLHENLSTVERELGSAPPRGELWDLLAAKFAEVLGPLEEQTAVDEEWRAKADEVDGVVDEEVIAEVVSKMTGVPLTRLSTEESLRLMKMEEALHKRVVSQENAVAAVSKAVRRSRSGLKDPRRPTGCFIFAGPTGVGKTLLAKALAEYLFGDDDALVQIDMNPSSGTSERSPRIIPA